MKKLIFILLGISLSFISCKKFLKTEPTDFLSEKDYYDTKDKINVALAGVYQPLASNRVYGGSLLNEFGAANDEAFVRWNYVTNGAVVNAFDNGSPRVYDYWKQLYTGIERANVLLHNIDLPKISEEERNVIKGETIFLRAYYHFLLASYFGDVPLKDKRSEDPTALQVTRTPVKEVYDFILSEMEAAIPLVKKSADVGHAGRVSQTVIKGILARVCLTRAGAAFAKEGDNMQYYQAALKWAKEVVDSKEHRLLETFDAGITNSAYSQVFINAHQNKYDIGESMWEVEFSGDGTDNRNLGTLGNDPGITTQFSNKDIIAKYGYNYNNFNVTSQFVDLYEAGDLRWSWAVSPYDHRATDGAMPLEKVYVDYNVGNGFNPGYQIGKWRREYENVANKVNSNTSINFAILRYADVLLMLAEAENEVNGPTELAYDAINKVRRRGFGQPVNSPAAGSFTSIRQIALAGYGGGTGSGYLRGPVPFTLTDASGTGAELIPSVDPASGRISGVFVKKGGRGYTNNVTLEFQNPWPANTPNWQSNTDYALNTYVKNGANYYRVSRAGRSTGTGPTQTGQGVRSNPAITGAEFEFAQKATVFQIVVGTSAVDLFGLSKNSFRESIKKERSRELCFEALRKQDLVRWGDFVNTMATMSQYFRAISGYWSYGHLAFSNASFRNLLLPIPGGEIASNKLFTQNPGW